MLEKHHEVTYKRCFGLVDLVHSGTIHRIRAFHLHTMCFPNNFQMLFHIHVMPNHIISHRMGHHSLVHNI
jgi:hypothetical protein